MLTKAEFKFSAEVFDAGYAIMTAGVNMNEFNWRFKGEFFATPVVDYELLCVNGTRVPAYPITELEKHRAGKTN